MFFPIQLTTLLVRRINLIVRDHLGDHDDLVPVLLVGDEAVAGELDAGAQDGVAGYHAGL